MIPVNKYSSRQGERVRLVVIHTSEGARDVAGLAAFLNRPGVQASYHGAVDDHRYEAYVDYSYAAWHLRNGNQESDGLCLCAFAGWSRAEWLRHPRMLELTAAWIAERCTARGLPVVRLADHEVGQAIRNDAHPGGWCDHHGYTRGTGDGTHWDVGENFPFDLVGRRAQQIAQQEDTVALTDEDISRIAHRVSNWVFGPDPQELGDRNWVQTKETRDGVRQLLARPALDPDVLATGLAEAVRAAITEALVKVDGTAGRRPGEEGAG